MNDACIDINLERALIASILIDPSELPKVRTEVRDVDFFLEKHRLLYGRILALCDLGQPFDVALLTRSFEADGTLPVIGGVAYLSGLLGAEANTWNAPVYARNLRVLAAQRGARQDLQTWAEDVHAADDVGKWLGQRADELKARAAALEQVAEVKIGEVAKQAFHLVFDDVYGQASGWSTGIEALDLAMDDLRPKKFYVFYARSGMGKTCLVCSFIPALARAGVPVTGWTGEMSKQRYLLRIAQGMAGVDLRSVKRRVGIGGRPMEESEVRIAVDHLQHALQEIASWGHVQIIDERRMTPTRLQAVVRRHHGEWGPGVVFSDYLQKMQPDSKQRSREEAIRELSAGHLNIAHEEGCAVVTMGQISRKIFERESKRPTQSDIREGDAPLFDADFFAFLHRQVYYDARKNGVRERDLPGHREGELLIEKNRDGDLGAVPLRFYGEHQLFTGQ